MRERGGWEGEGDEEEEEEEERKLLYDLRRRHFHIVKTRNTLTGKVSRRCRRTIRLSLLPRLVPPDAPPSKPRIKSRGVPVLDPAPKVNDCDSIFDPLPAAPPARGTGVEMYLRIDPKKKEKGVCTRRFSCTVWGGGNNQNLRAFPYINFKKDAFTTRIV